MMLLEKRRARNESEQMILNNCQGMLAIEERLKYRDLDMDALFDLHATLTRDTINDADVGRLRRNIEPGTGAAVPGY